jgi:hypothetical protein
MISNLKIVNRFFIGGQGMLTGRIEHGAKSGAGTARPHVFSFGQQTSVTSRPRPDSGMRPSMAKFAGKFALHEDRQSLSL